MCSNVHCSTIYDSQDMEANYMSSNRGVDKEDVIHIQNGILLSHKKEQNNAICSNTDGPHFIILSFVLTLQAAHTPSVVTVPH